MTRVTVSLYDEKSTETLPVDRPLQPVKGIDIRLRGTLWFRLNNIKISKSCLTSLNIGLRHFFCLCYIEKKITKFDFQKLFQRVLTFWSRGVYLKFFWFRNPAIPENQEGEV